MNPSYRLGNWADFYYNGYRKGELEMKMIQQFLHLERSDDEVFAGVLGKTIRQMENTLPFEKIVVRQVVPHEGETFTVILDCYYGEQSDMDH